jgi:hypothetical protein
MLGGHYVSYFAKPRSAPPPVAVGSDPASAPPASAFASPPASSATGGAGGGSSGASSSAGGSDKDKDKAKVQWWFATDSRTREATEEEVLLRQGYILFYSLA